MFRSKEKLQEEAQKAVSRGQYDKALKQYQKLVERDPTDVRVLIKLGDVHHRKGGVAEAIISYQQAGDRYAERGFHQKAIAVYKRILQLDRTRIDVNFRIGQLYEDQQLLGDAVTIYESAAEAYLRAGDSDKAMSIYQHMIELDSGNVALRLQFSELLSRLGKTERAALHLQETAQILREEGRTQDYIKVAERLLFHKTNDIALAQELAEAYLETGEHHQALAKLHVAFQADAQNTNTLRLLGFAFEGIGKIDKAANVFKEAARLHAQRTEFAECEGMLRKALELTPNDEKAQILLERIAKERADQEPVRIPSIRPASVRPPSVRPPSIKPVYEAPAQMQSNSIIEVLPLDETLQGDDIEIDITGRKQLEELKRASKKSHTPAKRPKNISVNPLAPMSAAAFDDLPMDEEQVTPDDGELHERLEDNLELVDNLMIEARFTEAESLIARLQSKMGSHPLVIGKKKTLEAMRRQPALPSLRAQSFSNPSASTTGAKSVESADLRPKYLNPEDQPSSRVKPPTPPSVPLMLRKEPTGKNANLSAASAAAPAPKRERAQHIDRVLEDFRAAVDQQIDAGDSQAHFDLGTAYRGMGLFGDARREFEMATRDSTRACISWTMLGQCWMDEGNALEALKAFSNALASENKEGVDELAVMFELGNAQEAVGKLDEALSCYTRIAEADAHFRDVSQRIQRIQDSGVIRKFDHSDEPVSSARS